MEFNKIVILQSLSASDCKTGYRLRDDIELLAVNYGRNIPVEVIDVPSEAEFFQALENLREDALRGARPILQIECHGLEDKSGLTLEGAPGSPSIPWDKLRSALIPVNVATKLNLLVVLGACYGAHAFQAAILQSIVKAERAACWGLIGPTEQVLPDELLSAQTAIYKELLRPRGANEPLSLAMLPGFAKGVMLFFSAQACFKEFKAMYTSEHSSSSMLKRRAKKIADGGREEFGVSVKTKDTEAELRKQQELFFEKCEEQFFLLDLYPELAEQFP